MPLVLVNKSVRDCLSKPGKSFRRHGSFLVHLLSPAISSEVGKYFGINNYSMVSSAIEQVKFRMNEDRIID